MGLRGLHGKKGGCSGQKRKRGPLIARVYVGKVTSGSWGLEGSFQETCMVPMAAGPTRWLPVGSQTPPNPGKTEGLKTAHTGKTEACKTPPRLGSVPTAPFLPLSRALSPLAPLLSGTGRGRGRGAHMLTALIASSQEGEKVSAQLVRKAFYDCISAHRDLFLIHPMF